MLGGEVPPINSRDFEQLASDALAKLTDEELASWLKFGRAPLRRAGEDLARERPTPRNMGPLVNALLLRPRLAGAEPYLAQMVTALSLPPRRGLPEQLPLGGYSEVSNRGGIDRILPSQHALDDLEFMRRFSEHELLYFRREEPPANRRYELVIVLDQGVRCWGDVRLVLTAAALALTRLGERRKMSVQLICGSRPDQLFDVGASFQACPIIPPGTASSSRVLQTEKLGSSSPRTDVGASFQACPIIPPETASSSRMVQSDKLGSSSPRCDVADALEASDFSRNPGLALESALEWPAAAPRDVLLLTHPLNIEEDDVRNAARRLTAPHRLFALTMNGKGDAELVELRRGLPVRLRSFHVDFIEAKIPEAAAPPASSGWQGDVEPIGWPFRFGTSSPFRLFGFDYVGRRLLAVLENSMIYCWDLNSGEVEILPRPMIDGRLITEWRHIAGVAAGFALLGIDDGHFVVAHFDCHERRCRVHRTGRVAKAAAICLYVRNCHSIVFASWSSPVPLFGIDLSTGEISLNAVQQGRTHRAVQQVREGSVHFSPSELFENSNLGQSNRGYLLNAEEGILKYSDGVRNPMQITLERDGKKVLRNAVILNVELADRTLAVRYRPFRSDQQVLGLFNVGGNFIREIDRMDHLLAARKFFQLSRDGERIAWLRDRLRLEVEATGHPQPVLRTHLGGIGGNSRLWVGDHSMLLSCGRHGYAWHLLRWSDGRLEVISEINRAGKDHLTGFQKPEVAEFFHQRHGFHIAKVDAGNPLSNDTVREAKSTVRGGCCFVLDRFGQVLVFDAQSKLIFQFYAYGDSWSAWLPDGSRSGLGMVHAWPNTPHVRRKMGEALRAATGGRS